MKSQRSLISFSYQQSRKSSRSKVNKQKQQNLENLCIDIGQQISNIKKQLKSKVSRSQFISSLSSKLSISQLSYLNIGSKPNKQNITPNNNVKYEDKFEKLENKIYEIQQNIKQNTILTTRKINEQINEIREQIEQCRRQLPKFQQQLTYKNNVQKHRLSQIQAYIFKKVDRSQIDKLFTLNQLLVIQIQQAKRKCQQINKLLNIKSYQLNNQLKQIQLKQQQKYMQMNIKINNIQQKLKIKQEQQQQQIDKIINILQIKQNQKQYNSQISSNLMNNYNISINNINERLNKLEQQQNLSYKQMLTRINVLQLKQNQINRSVKQVDSMKNQLLTFKLDISQLYSKSNQVNINIKQYFNTILQDTQHLMESKINKQMEIMCAEIMKKVISLTSQLVSNQQMDNLVNPIKDKYRQVNLLHIQNTKKIDFLQQKQMELLENLEEEIQKNQERLSLIRKDFMGCVTQKQLLQVQQKCVKIDEIKAIGKQIDKKIDLQINKIVQDQNKINQVICSQNILAKWFWTQGSLKGGNLVGWDKLIINTLPQNFKWVKNQPQIIISKSGYYKIQLGFYSKKKPTVQLIVNGQTIISAVNSSSYVLHHSSGKLKDVSNSQISGLTYVDFLLLPDGARIAISYIGEFTGEGFLSIQRL